MKYSHYFFVMCIAGGAHAQDVVNVASQCVIGSVKLSWKPPRRCTVYEDQGKFKEAMDALGWQISPAPKIDWSKESVVFDIGDNPYGNATPICTGLFSETNKKAATLSWGWTQNIEPSSVAKAKAKADKTEPPANDKTIIEKAKESFSNVPEEGKQKLNDLVTDMKKFPSPIPKRAGVLAIFPKAARSKYASIDCVIQK